MGEVDEAYRQDYVKHVVTSVTCYRVESHKCQAGYSEKHSARET